MYHHLKFIMKTTKRAMMTNSSTRLDRRPSLSKISYTIFTVVFLFLFVCVWLSITEVQFEVLKKLSVPMYSFTSSNTSLIEENSTQITPPDMRILLGVSTLPNSYNRRHFLRLVYGIQSPKGARVDLKFIFCHLTNDDQRVLIALEIMRYDDIIILNCEENMNRGKTYTYFSSLPEMFNNTEEQNGKYPPYDFVVKADDDTYFRLESLVESLKPLPKEDLYYGFVIPCSSMDPFKHYMSGMGFLVSWDIVEWIRTAATAREHLVGPEDRVFGDWMRRGKRGQNRFNAKWSMYNYPQPPSPCAHDLVPDTIAVHLLKNDEKWIKTLKFFNVTDNLKPSKLYHLS
ncbi:uncharacterized protein LOC113362007 [Papaver somniferum]|nr:uncharacterized protein LOC113362007 [Papaver somniferum]